jgi:uncharacterized phage protein (TIGR02220 family)
LEGAVRIRTIKPEWLEDEKLVVASSDARVLSVALILLADDYGRGRGHPARLGSRVFPADPGRGQDALDELVSLGFTRLYVVRDQTYFEIVNWERHQRVDRPGKPHVPPPSEEIMVTTPEQAKASYFIRGSITGMIKIGHSIDPVQRLVALAACASEELELLAVCDDREAHLHEQFAFARAHGEWFRPCDEIHAKIRELNPRFPEPIARAGYCEGNRVVTKDRVGHAKDRVGHATDQDQDQDQDHRPRPTPRVEGEAKDDPIPRILAALSEASGRRYRPTTSSHRKLVEARLAEYSESQLLAVIRDRAKRWRGTEQDEYIRPSTLFRASKFPEYLAVAESNGQRRGGAFG